MNWGSLFRPSVSPSVCPSVFDPKLTHSIIFSLHRPKSYIQILNLFSYKNDFCSQQSQRRKRYTKWYLRSKGSTVHCDHTKSHSISEITEKQYAASCCHSSMWPKATTLEKSLLLRSLVKITYKHDLYDRSTTINVILNWKMDSSVKQPGSARSRSSNSSNVTGLF